MGMVFVSSFPSYLFRCLRRYTADVLKLPATINCMWKSVIQHVTRGARFACRMSHAKKRNCLHSYTLKKDAASIYETQQISISP